MKYRIVILVAMVLSFAMHAQDKNKKLSFEVDGVCGMCQMRIEKAALSVKGVKYAFWDMETHQLDLIMDERKTNSMEVKTAIVAVGHDTKELKATEDAYNSVYPCCRYRDENSKEKHHH